MKRTTVKIQLPDGAVIDRTPFAEQAGNFCQLFIRYKNHIFAVGDGDEYIRGIPNLLRMSYMRQKEGGNIHIIYPDVREKYPSLCASRDYAELSALV